MWGIAITGVKLFNGLSAAGLDPFYPIAYGSVTDPSGEVKRVDQCLSHPGNNGIFHYHLASPCIANSGHLGTATSSGAGVRFTGDAKATILSEFSEHMPFRSALGISKDGRPIYTPLHSGG